MRRLAAARAIKLLSVWGMDWLKGNCTNFCCPVKLKGSKQVNFAFLKNSSLSLQLRDSDLKCYHRSNLKRLIRFEMKGDWCEGLGDGWTAVQHVLLIATLAYWLRQEYIYKYNHSTVSLALHCKLLCRICANAGKWLSMNIFWNMCHHHQAALGCCRSNLVRFPDWLGLCNLTWSNLASRGTLFAGS